MIRLGGVLCWKYLGKRISQRNGVEWMKQVIEGGKVGINLNSVPGQFFNTHKGLRQGDPLSPLLFNLVNDAFATMMDKARMAGRGRGLVQHLVKGGSHTYNMQMTP
jgi:hypothetical protein